MSKDIFLKYVTYEIESSHVDGQTKKKLVKYLSRKYGDEDGWKEQLNDEEYPTFCISGEDAEKFNISGADVYDVTWEIDDSDGRKETTDMLEREFANLIGRHPKYLVCADDCKWQDKSGFAFYNSVYQIYLKCKCFFLDEEGKYAIKGHNNSGLDVIIVGLSYDEFEELQDKEYDEIHTFAESRF